MVTYSFHLYSRSSISFHSVFHSFHGLMNSINWPASSVWVFIAQLGEHCSANAEATGSNPVEAPKIFFSGYFRNCLNCDSLRWSHTHSICIPAVQYHFIHPPFCLRISRQSSVVGPRNFADDRELPLFGTIEAIIWKPAIAPIVPIVSIVSKIF